MKYHIITFGCQMNKADSERIAMILENKGYLPASRESEADLIVVNMCSVRQSAVDRVFGLMPKFQKLKAQNPKLKTILTGCILKEDRKKFAKGFDLILDIKDLPNWPNYLSSKGIYLTKPWHNYCNNYLSIVPKYQNNFSAFIPISNGCNNFCSYCVVPFVRGPLICRSYLDVLKEVKNAIDKGFKEIWLLGQNVNDYRSGLQPTHHPPTFGGPLTRISTRKNAKINFAKLLRVVNDIPGNFWIRFTSPHPKDFSDELIETMAKCQKVTPYLNLPVQSGDNEILKRMNRPYTMGEYKNLVKKIRATFKKYRKGLEREIAISTDIIVGFPGETKKQFENTVKLFKEIKFDMAYIAKFSPRPGTAAAKLKDNVSPKEKERRYKILTEILKETALEKNKKYIGRTIEVLIEAEQGGYLRGKTRNHKTIKFIGPKNLIGQFVKIKVTDALPWGLKGNLIKKS